MKIRKEFLPLSRPSLGDEEIEAVAALLRNGWITSGPKVAEFEKRFCQLTGAPHAIAISSATAGMHMILTVLGVGPGDEVVTPSMTFASTVNQIYLRNAKPVFADSDYGTLQVLPADIARRITSRTKAVIPVHFGGSPADLQAIQEAAEKAGIFIIEDAAHAIGTSYRGKVIGGHGNPAIFSFHPIKNITTGEGGMITCFDDKLARELRLLRFHGIERDAWKRYGKGGTPHYDIMVPGYKYNLTDLQASIGIVQLNKLQELNARRKYLAHRYLEGLRGVSGIDLPESPSYPHEHAWHLFIIKVTTMDRDSFSARLAEYNIGTGLHFPPCHLLSFICREFGTKEGDLPGCEAAGKRIISLPLFPAMDDSDVDYVCASIRKILAGVEQ
jgi:UDP-4-amino-4-deoxy-L-arabinose-oxoglutarate aminotransferase